MHPLEVQAGQITAPHERHEAGMQQVELQVRFFAQGHKLQEEGERTQVGASVMTAQRSCKAGNLISTASTPNAVDIFSNLPGVTKIDSKIIITNCLDQPRAQIKYSTR